MPRIAGVDIPNEKRIEIALSYIYGIGPARAKEILKIAQVSSDIRAKNISEEEASKIRAAISELKLPVEGEAKRIVSQNIRRLQEIKSYRGNRHRQGLPVRGQSTRRNARTRKGKRKTVGGQKKKLAKK